MWEILLKSKWQTKAEDKAASTRFTNRTLAVSDILGLPPTSSSISFLGCRSKEWQQIGKLLALIPGLLSIDVVECDSAD